MAEGGSKGGGLPALNFNTLLAIFTLVGSVWFVSQKLTSDRPVTPAGGSRPFVGEQTLEARLWEDPFKTPDQDSRRGKLTVPHNFDDLIAQIAVRSKTGNTVLLLPVMVSGGDYSEDQESRIRSRFAVVSGLSESGYAPDDAEHLGAIRIPWPTQNEVDLVKGHTNYSGTHLWNSGAMTNLQNATVETNVLAPFGLVAASTMDVHYEWYRRRTFFPQPADRDVPAHVLVLWLDDSFFEDEPLLRLPLLLEPLSTNKVMGVSLIGPRRSSTLRALLPGKMGGSNHLWIANGALWKKAQRVLRQIEIYSATPSAMDEVLITAPLRRPRRSVREALVEQGFKDFRNFAATDAQLAREVIKELELRDVHLNRPHNNHLVLISEWDTFYARMLSLTYAAEIAVGQGASNRATAIASYLAPTDPKPLPENFHPFVYLRGLDGQTVGGQANGSPAKEGRSRTPTTSFDELRQWAPDANKAEGQAQFDYLGRLGTQIEELHGRLQRGNGRVKIAVGIVGSDVYDTLLILQALRSRFPNFFFFTTDLDARFWHPRERKWSRNLLTASSYGLTLHPQLQGSIAPFRDSTQTAQFAATLAALKNISFASFTNPLIPPRRFEIGNDGPVNLSVEPGRLPGSRGPHWQWLHPLTRFDNFLISQNDNRTSANAWSTALDLITTPFEKENSRNGKSRGSSPLILSLLGLVPVMVLACVFWRPLRARTIGLVSFVREPLHYRACDVGGKEGVKTLLREMAAAPQHSTAGGWLAQKWREYFEPATHGTLPFPAPLADATMEVPPSKVIPERRVVPADMPASTPAISTPAETTPPAQPGTATDSAKARKKDSPDSKFAEVEAAADLDRSYAFVSFLNGLLREKLPPELKSYVEHIRNRGILGACGRFGRTWENRCVLDAVLYQITPEASRNGVQPAPCSARNAARKLSRLRCGAVLGFWLAMIVLVILTCWIGSDIWHSTYENPTSEPFSLTNGISGWPAIVLRWIAVTFSIIFCFNLCSRMRVLFYELTRCYRFGLQREQSWPSPRAGLRAFLRTAVRRIAGTDSDDPPPRGRVRATDLWHQYRQQSRFLRRVLRILVPCLLYFFLANIIYQLFGASFQPLRGEEDNSIREWAKFQLPFRGYVVANLTFFFLTFLTIDAAWLCRRFIVNLNAGNVDYPDETRAYFRDRNGNVPDDCLDDWIGTHLIADLTDRIGRMLWFPAIVLMLLLMARINFWDHWPWDAARIIIMILNFCIALASVVILQRAAHGAKHAAEERLATKVKRLQFVSAESAAKSDAEQAKELLKEIQEIRHGAFGSIWENPVLGTILLGPGGLTILQMLVWFLSK